MIPTNTRRATIAISSSHAFAQSTDPGPHIVSPETSRPKSIPKEGMIWTYHHTSTSTGQGAK